MSQEGIPKVITSNMGSMAGTPLADIAFTVCVSRIIFILRSTMEQDNLTSSICVNGNTHGITDVSFVDDGAIPVVAGSEEVVPKMIAIARVAFSVFACYKLALNFLPGKSEATVVFAGKGKGRLCLPLLKLGMFPSSSRFPVQASSFASSPVINMSALTQTSATKLPYDVQLCAEGPLG